MKNKVNNKMQLAGIMILLLLLGSWPALAQRQPGTARTGSRGSNAMLNTRRPTPGTRGVTLDARRPAPVTRVPGTGSAPLPRYRAVRAAQPAGAANPAARVVRPAEAARPARVARPAEAASPAEAPGTRGVTLDARRPAFGAGEAIRRPTPGVRQSGIRRPTPVTRSAERGREVTRRPAPGTRLPAQERRYNTRRPTPGSRPPTPLTGHSTLVTRSLGAGSAPLPQSGAVRAAGSLRVRPYAFNPWSFTWQHRGFLPFWHRPYMYYYPYPILAYPVSGLGFTWYSSSFSMGFSLFSGSLFWQPTWYAPTWYYPGWYSGFSHIYQPWPVYNSYYVYEG